MPIKIHKFNKPFKKLSLVTLLTLGGLGASSVMHHTNVHASNNIQTEMPYTANENHLIRLGESDNEVNNTNPNNPNHNYQDNTGDDFNDYHNSKLGISPDMDTDTPATTNSTTPQTPAEHTHTASTVTPVNTPTSSSNTPSSASSSATNTNQHQSSQNVQPVAPSSNTSTNNNTNTNTRTNNTNNHTNTNTNNSNSKNTNDTPPIITPSGNGGNMHKGLPHVSPPIVHPTGNTTHKQKRSNNGAPVINKPPKSNKSNTHKKSSNNNSNDNVTFFVKNQKDPTHSNVYTGSLNDINKDDTTPDTVEIIENNPKVINQNLSDLYNHTFKMINNYRTQKGLNPVTINHNLNHLATLRAQQISTNFSHYNSKGQSLEDLEAPSFNMAKNPTDAGYHMSENIAISYLSPNIMMPTDPVHYRSENGDQMAYEDNDAMFNHDAHEPNWGHRLNILNPYSTEVGIGSYYDKDTGDYSLVEDFWQPNIINEQQMKEYIKNALAGIKVDSASTNVAYNNALAEKIGHYAKKSALLDGFNQQFANKVYHQAYKLTKKEELKY